MYKLEGKEIMSEHDALVLPSIVEGRALVQQEALSCGLPIIVTPNTGGEDLVEEGETGYLVPIRSPVKIAEAINSMIANRKNMDDIQSCAKKKLCNTPGKNTLKTLLISTCLTMYKGLNLPDP